MNIRISSHSYLLDLLWKLVQSLNNFWTTGLCWDTILWDHKGKHNKGNHLGSVGLCGSNTNLRSSINMHSTVRLSADRRADCVSNSYNQGTTLFTVSEITVKFRLHPLTKILMRNVNKMFFLFFTFFMILPESHESICSFSRLWNKEAHIISEDRCVAVKEVWGQINHYREFSELLQQLPCCNCWVVWCSASNK